MAALAPGVRASFVDVVARGRVWVVEDSPLEAEMARRALAPRHAVEVFADGAVVLERIANGVAPDVLVLDSQLPTLTGLEICRFVRVTFDETTLPIVILTVEAQRGSIVEGLAAGANDYLTKPYDVAELRARVGVLVRTSHLQHVQSRRARYAALAAEVGGNLAQGGAEANLATMCVAALARHLDAPLVTLFAMRYGGAALETAAGPLAHVAGTSRVVASLADEIAAAAAGRTITKLDAALAAKLPNVRALVGVPLVLDARVAGVLLVAFRREVAPEELDALTALAQLVALGLERVRAEHDRALLLERELRARAEAEAATRAKDEFLALVSHELRSPLNVVLGWADLLSRDVEGAEGAERASLIRGLDVIRRSARAQARLIDDLLDVTRIMSGKLRIDTASVDLVDAVEGVVEALRPAAAAAGVTLTTNLAARAAPIAGDVGRLRQVVSNLVSNAIKFTPDGGSVCVRVQRDGACIVLSVEDTGRGIDAEFLPNVFDRFRQADASMRRRHGGLGLGLSIVRHIVELHGGTVTAESAGVGRGATFVVRLPAADPSGEQDGAPPASTAPETLDGLEVLYVDDDPDAREFVARVLGDARAHVRTASSVQDALALVRAAPTDVVLSDLAMPDEDGFTLVRKLRQHGRGRAGGPLPIVALTAYGQLDDEAKTEAAGFDLHLTKPIAPLDLVGAIARLVRRSQVPR